MARPYLFCQARFEFFDHTPREAFEKCEELFEKYGISEEDKGWFLGVLS
jgi:hypothetical protein